MGLCKKCGREKTLRPRGAFTCLPCNAEAERTWRKKNPEWRREYYERTKERDKERYRENPDVWRDTNLRVKYGISISVYTDMFKACGGLCSICGKPEPTIRGGQRILLSVDHDRGCCNGRKSCGACVRGLLCSACNKAVGLFRDDPASMRRAADYIEFHRKAKPLSDDVPVAKAEA